MKFYDRQSELQLLEEMHVQSLLESRMTVMTGRRRIGKTHLALEFGKNLESLYFFVSKKSEILLVQEYLAEIRNNFELPVIGEIKTFIQIFELILRISEQKHVTLIIDEFQEFYSINPAVFSEMQRVWDLHKSKTKLNLIVIGSIHSLMKKIFQNAKEPLFGRADRILVLKPFSVETVRTILIDFAVTDAQSLFDFYVFTGGLPKYINLLLTNNQKHFSQILNFICQENSPFLMEGRYQLIEEFGRDYTIYFSILELIANGKTSRSEIESILQRQTGGYLERLENDYGLITKMRPINAKPGGRNVKYQIDDNFLQFWFRFILKNRAAIEANNFSYLKQVIKNGYPNYCGRMLEKYFRQIMIESGRFNRIGSYWEKSNLNEIDLVAINDLEKFMIVAEIKMNKKKIDLRALENKAQRLIEDYSDYQVNFLALGSEDAGNFLSGEYFNELK